MPEQSERNVYDYIRDALEAHPRNDDATIAIEVLNALKVARKPAVLLVPVLSAAIGTMRRARVRAAEDAAFDSPRDEVGMEAVDTLAARRQLIEESFTLDGVRILWGDATPEQHELYAEQIEGPALATLETVRRHRLAAKAIREAGAKCLRDVKGWAA